MTHMHPFEHAWVVLKDFDFRPPSDMTETDFGPSFASFGRNINYPSIEPQRTLRGGTPVNYIQSGTREQRDLYPEIYGEMPEGILPRAPHYRPGTSKPRSIDDRGRFVGVNLPVMGNIFNYQYGDERLDSDANLRYLSDMLAHEHGHAAIDDELRALGRRNPLEHEFGAYTMQGLDSEETQDALRSRGLVE